MDWAMLRKTLTGLTVSTLASRPISALMDPLRDQCVPVFMLHRIADTQHNISGHSLEHIERALQYLKSHGYHGISIRQLVDALRNGTPLPHRAVAFTMDDGFYEQAELALPLFEKYRMPITMFLATDMLDKQSWSWDYKLDYLVNTTSRQHLDIEVAQKQFSATWSPGESRRPFIRKVRAHLKSQPIQVTLDAIDQLSQALHLPLPEKAPVGFRAMTWSQARSFESEYIEFGPHTRGHLILSQLSHDQAVNEITQSIGRLNDELKHPVPVFCYPTGRPTLDFGGREKQMVRDAGCLAALSTEPGQIDVRAQSRDDLYALKRLSFPEDMINFYQYCSWIERAKSLIPGRQLRIKKEPSC